MSKQSVVSNSKKRSMSARREEEQEQECQAARSALPQSSVASAPRTQPFRFSPIIIQAPPKNLTPKETFLCLITMEALDEPKKDSFVHNIICRLKKSPFSSRVTLPLFAANIIQSFWRNHGRHQTTRAILTSFQETRISRDYVSGLSTRHHSDFLCIPTDLPIVEKTTQLLRRLVWGCRAVLKDSVPGLRNFSKVMVCIDKSHILLVAHIVYAFPDEFFETFPPNSFEERMHNKSKELLGEFEDICSFLDKDPLCQPSSLSKLGKRALLNFLTNFDQFKGMYVAWNTDHKRRSVLALQHFLKNNLRFLKTFTPEVLARNSARCKFMQTQSSHKQAVNLLRLETTDAGFREFISKLEAFNNGAELELSPLQQSSTNDVILTINRTNADLLHEMLIFGDWKYTYGHEPRYEWQADSLFTHSVAKEYLLEIWDNLETQLAENCSCGVLFHRVFSSLFVLAEGIHKVRQNNHSTDAELDRFISSLKSERQSYGSIVENMVRMKRIVHEIVNLDHADFFVTKWQQIEQEYIRPSLQDAQARPRAIRVALEFLYWKSQDVYLSFTNFQASGVRTQHMAQGIEQGIEQERRYFNSILQSGDTALLRTTEYINNVLTMLCFEDEQREKDPFWISFLGERARRSNAVKVDYTRKLAQRDHGAVREVLVQVCMVLICKNCRCVRDYIPEIFCMDFYRLERHRKFFRFYVTAACLLRRMNFAKHSLIVNCTESKGQKLKTISPLDMEKIIEETTKFISRSDDPAMGRHEFLGGLKMHLRDNVRKIKNWESIDVWIDASVKLCFDTDQDMYKQIFRQQRVLWTSVLCSGGHINTVSLKCFAELRSFFAPMQRVLDRVIKLLNVTFSVHQSHFGNICCDEASKILRGVSPAAQAKASISPPVADDAAGESSGSAKELQAPQSVECGEAVKQEEPKQEEPEKLVSHEACMEDAAGDPLRADGDTESDSHEACMEDSAGDPLRADGDTESDSDGICIEDEVRALLGLDIAPGVAGSGLPSAIPPPAHSVDAKRIYNPLGP